MCAALVRASSAARRTLEEVDAALGERLSSVMFSGPASALSLTATTQPALLAHSVASWRAVCEAVAARGGRPPAPAAACGHSVGEYAALVTAESLALGDAARLLRLRGLAMQAAADGAGGGGTAMVALLFSGAGEAGAVEDRVRAACAEAARSGPGVASLAALNSPSQAVVSGHAGAVQRVVALLHAGAAAAAGGGAAPRLRRAAPLPVSAPFHCSLMHPAGEALREALTTVPLDAPAWPLFAGRSGARADAPAALREALVGGVSEPVLWARSVGAAVAEAGGEPLLLEAGGNGACAALARQCVKGVRAVGVGTPEEVAAAVGLIME
jgi:[acyl-carrier-protein] S-malonyltransferase